MTSSQGAPPSLSQLQRHMMAPPPTEPETRLDARESHDSLREIKIGDPEVHNSSDQQHHHRSSQDRLNSAKVQKSVSNNTLSSRNLSLHDGVVGESPESPLDLDQTTMIGSALDLDSLEGDRSEPQQTSQNGSQVGCQQPFSKSCWTICSRVLKTGKLNLLSFTLPLSIISRIDSLKRQVK